MKRALSRMCVAALCAACLSAPVVGAKTVVGDIPDTVVQFVAALVGAGHGDKGHGDSNGSETGAAQAKDEMTMGYDNAFTDLFAPYERFSFEGSIKARDALDVDLRQAMFPNYGVDILDSMGGEFVSLYSVHTLVDVQPVYHDGLMATFRVEPNFLAAYKLMVDNHGVFDKAAYDANVAYFQKRENRETFVKDVWAKADVEEENALYGALLSVLKWRLGANLYDEATRLENRGEKQALSYGMANNLLWMSSVKVTDLKQGEATRDGVQFGWKEAKVNFKVDTLRLPLAVLSMMTVDKNGDVFMAYMATTQGDMPYWMKALVGQGDSVEK